MVVQVLDLNCSWVEWKFVFVVYEASEECYEPCRGRSSDGLLFLLNDPCSTIPFLFGLQDNFRLCIG